MSIVDKIRILFESKQILYEEGKFKPGQAWLFQTKENNNACKLIILKCETLNEQSIIHIAIKTSDSRSDEFLIQHLPMSKAAIEHSVITLQETDTVLSDYTEGYRQWRTAFDKGEAGVWEIAVCDVLEAVMQFKQQF